MVHRAVADHDPCRHLGTGGTVQTDRSLPRVYGEDLAGVVSDEHLP